MKRNEPILIVPLDKAWSKEARAAALAARKAKTKGLDPKKAAEAAKEAVRGGASVSAAVASSTKGGAASSGGDKRSSGNQRVADTNDKGSSRVRLKGEEGVLYPKGTSEKTMKELAQKRAESHKAQDAFRDKTVEPALKKMREEGLDVNHTSVDTDQDGKPTGTFTVGVRSGKNADGETKIETHRVGADGKRTKIGEYTVPGATKKTENRQAKDVRDATDDVIKELNRKPTESSGAIDRMVETVAKQRKLSEEKKKQVAAAAKRAWRDTEG